MEMYSYNVCISSSVIVQHAALRELDFSGLCLMHILPEVVEASGLAQWSSLQATLWIVMMDMRPFGIQHLVGSRNRLKCASCTE